MKNNRFHNRKASGPAAINHPQTNLIKQQQALMKNPMAAQD